LSGKIQVDRQETTLQTPTSKAECKTLSLMCTFFLCRSGVGADQVNQGGPKLFPGPLGTEVRTHPNPQGWAEAVPVCPNCSQNKAKAPAMTLQKPHQGHKKVPPYLPECEERAMPMGQPKTRKVVKDGKRARAQSGPGWGSHYMGERAPLLPHPRRVRSSSTSQYPALPSPGSRFLP
jgi:hypothetical protein